MSLMLSSDVASNSKLPKEYNLQVVKSVPANTFVFTEKDLAAYNPRLQEAGAQDEGMGVNGAARSVPRPGFQDRAKNQLQYTGRNRKWHPYQRRTIPSKTILIGLDEVRLNSYRADCHCWLH